MNKLTHLSFAAPAGNEVCVNVASGAIDAADEVNIAGAASDAGATDAASDENGINESIIAAKSIELICILNVDLLFIIINTVSFNSLLRVFPKLCLRFN